MMNDEKADGRTAEPEDAESDPTVTPTCREGGGDICSQEGESSPMSKRQKKRLLKHQQWLQRKEEMRKNRKTERRKNKEKRQLTGEPPKKIYKMASEEASQVKVAIDCDYDDLMSNKDIRQFVKQIQRSYAENRRSPKPLQFYLCNLTGKTADVLNECSPGYVNWDVHIKSEKPTEIFSKEKIVYLTSDSPNVLEVLDEDKIYIIGGLVDHNHHKGLCYKRAVETGISHAQLPISDYVKLQSRTVLVINHVFEILVKYVQSGDWRQAFFSVIPQRKGVSNLDNEDASSQGNDGEVRECDKPCPGDDEKVTKETASSSEDKEETDKETIATSSGKAKESKDNPGNDTNNDNRKGGEIDNEIGCETESVMNKEDKQSTDL